MAIHQPLLETSKASPCKTLCLLVSLLAIITTIALVTTHLTTTTPFSSQPLHIIEETLDRQSCLVQKMLVEVDGTARPLQCYLHKTKPRIHKTIQIANQVKCRVNSPRDTAALSVCMELMDISTDRIVDSVRALQDGTWHSHQDAHTWLSSVLTNHVTCLDGLEGLQSKALMEEMVNDLISRAKASLAMMVSISPPQHKDLEMLNDGDFPSWVSSRDRRLLESLSDDINPNVVVAADGSGNYKTVQDAVDSAPNNNQQRYIIKVKKGIYKEQVEIKKQCIMLVGDGRTNTIITGSLGYADVDNSTYKTATVAADGDGFIAQDIGFQNTAGPEKYQAVALRVGADKAVINRCYIAAYQDTLYAYSNRQFYRGTYIYGTVDFIFGNAAAVFQYCKLLARKPMDKQKNMVTAQGRTDENQNTGTSIQRCDIVPDSDLENLKGSIKTYLGRPWQPYSRTVVMQSNISDHIDPAGWSPWNDSSYALDTLYYGEYANYGLGAGLSNRVNWSGYHIITSQTEAHKFTVAEFIDGNSWLKDTGVPYVEGL